MRIIKSDEDSWLCIECYERAVYSIELNQRTLRFCHRCILKLTAGLHALHLTGV